MLMFSSFSKISEVLSFLPLLVGAFAVLEGMHALSSMRKTISAHSGCIANFHGVSGAGVTHTQDGERKKKNKP